MDVEAIRQQIPVTRNCIYMNTGWSGPKPTPVAQAIASTLEADVELGSATLDALERHRPIVAQLRESLARLLHCAPEELALTHNTTHGLQIVVNGIRWRPGDVAVTCSLEHAAVTNALQMAQRRSRIRVRTVEIQPQDPLDLILAKFDQAITPGTRLLFLSHIEYSCGLRLPAKELVELAHQRGALVLFDGAQTGGQLSLDLPALGADAYAIPGQKWLLGPDGTGVLYLRRELIPQLRPILRDPPAEEGVAEFALRNGSTNKFRDGTHSPALQAGQAAAVAFHLSAGPEAVERRSRLLGQRLREGLARQPGVTVLSPWEEPLTCGLITFAIHGREPAAASEELWRRYRIAGRRVANPAGVRLCTGFFNTEEEVDQAVAAVGGIASGG